MGNTDSNAARPAEPGDGPLPAGPSSPQLALRQLVDRGVLTAEQAAAVREALQLRDETAAVGRPARVPWAEIAGYLGGGLVLTGAIVLIASSWNELTETARTTLLATITVLLLVAGLVAAGGRAGVVAGRRRQTARSRVAGVLLALAAGATALTVGVALPGEQGSRNVAVSAGAGLVVAIAGYALLPTVFGLLCAVALGAVAVVSTVDAAVGATPLQAGLSLLVFGTLVAVLALAGVLRHRLVGFGSGAAVALFGAQQPLGEEGTAPWAYLLTLAVGVACLALYPRARSWVLLVFGVLAVTLAVPEAIWDITGGAVGGAAILLIAGAILIGASAVGFRLHRDVPPPA